MKAFKIFSMFALSVMMAACTSDEIEQVEKSQKTDGIPFFATISLDESASTRALTESGTDINAAWADGEKVALVHNGVVDEMSVTPTGDGKATISGTITGSPMNGDAVTVIYPASAVDVSTKDVKVDLLMNQNGLLTGEGSISSQYDLRKSAGATLKVDGTATLNGNVSLTSQIAIWKLTLQCGGAALSAKSLSVKDASDNLLASATLASAGNVFYVAIPATTSVSLFADNGTNIYTYSKSGITIATGKYYQSTVGLCCDLSATESANCYLVPAKGYYKFKATVKGNGSADLSDISKDTDPATINSAELIWATYNTTTAPAANELIQNIQYKDGYVYFSTGNTYKEGNALVAIRDNSNNILWSWHLWFESDNMEEQAQTDPVSGYIFMDRNLGALTNCYAADNALDFGFTYQRGRKDPFMTTATRTSYTALGVLGTYTSYSGSSGVANSIKNPTVVFGYDSWGGDGSLWSASSKTIFDPCPPGWHIAGVDAWNGFNSTNFVIYNNDWDTYHGRMYNGVAWYPATGDRWGSDHNNTGGRLDIWGERELYASSTEILGNAGSNPGHGYSIRAVKDVSTTAAKKSVASLTTNEIGWRLGNDGVAYSPTGTLPTGVTAEAVIAYVGAVTNYCDKFIAIALADAGGTPNWADALTAVGTYAAAHPININGTNYNSNSSGSDCYDLVYSSPTEHASNSATTLLKGWRLPSVTDWRYIIQGLCNGISATSPIGINQDTWAGSQGPTYRAAIAAACGVAMYDSNGSWWTSSERATDSNQAWLINFYESKFYSISKTSSGFVRAVFAY